MTPADINTYSRAKYNATSDTYFSDNEVFYYIYQAELELSNECEIVEAYASGIAVTQGTRQYAFPSNVRKIKRLELQDSSGSILKLEPITFREDDALTLVNVASTTQGKPQFYEIFNFNYYLRPVPDTSTYTVNCYSYNEPVAVTSGTQVLEIPTCFHMDLTDFVVMQFALKDKNVELAEAYAQRWTDAKLRIKRWVQKKKRTDAMTITMNEDNLAVTLTGPV